MRKGTAVAVFILTAMLTASASADNPCEIHHTTESYFNYDDGFMVTEGAPHVLIFEVLDPENPITDENFDGDITFEYGAETGELLHIRDGYWFMDFVPDNSVAQEEDGEFQSQINLTIQGETDGDTADCLPEMEEEYYIDHVSEDDYPEGVGEPELLNLEPIYQAGEDVTLNGSIGGLADEDFDLDLQHTILEEETLRTMTYQEEPGVLQDTFEIIDEHGSWIFFHLQVAQDDAYGTATFGATTASLLNIEEIEVIPDEDRCGSPNHEYDYTITESCEPGAEIEAEYEVENEDEVDVEEATMELVLENSEEATNETHTVEEMEEVEDDVFEGSITVPEINTTTYESLFHLNFTAETEYSSNYVTSHGGYDPFLADDVTSGPALQGEDHEIEIEVRRPFSGEMLDEEDLNLESSEVTLHDTEGDTQGSFTLDEADKIPGGPYTEELEIPEEPEEGQWNVDTIVFDNYNAERTESSPLQVLEADSTFLAEGLDEKDIRYEDEYDIWFNITNTSPDGQTREYNVNYLEDFEGSIENETVEVGYQEEEHFERTIEVENVRDMEGVVQIQDEEMDETQELEIEFNAPECEVGIGNMCLNEVEEALDVEQDILVPQIEEIEFIAVGEEDEQVEVEIETEGNITDVTEMNHTDGSIETNTTEWLQIEYDAEDEGPGYYDGTFNFTESDSEFHEADAELQATFDPQDVGISAGLIDLGELLEGDTGEDEIHLENTGEAEITGLTATSDDYDDVDIDDISLDPEETAHADVEIENVQYSGEITITGETNVDEDAETTATVSADVYDPDIESDLGDVQSDLEDLLLEDPSSSLEAQIDSAINEADEAKDEWDDENYSEAESMLNNLQSEYTSLQSQVEEETDPTGAPESPQQPGENGETEPVEGEEGGSGILIIAAALLTLLIIGFVLYTSLVPEEEVQDNSQQQMGY